MVFVLDTKKQPQPMLHPAEARRLLTHGKAAIFRRSPFTIILKDERASASKTYRLKIDYGSRHTGMALVCGNNVMWMSVLEHRTDIKAALDKRRGYRRRRRTANLRYRKARFAHRTRPEGWLPPSLTSRVGNIAVWVRRICRLAPVGAVSYENVKFDTQLMENPDISGAAYQQGELYGYEVREYLLEKFGRRCAYCGAENVPLQVEHIVPKSRGGSNRISNLTIACQACNQAKGSLTAEEFGHPNVQLQAKSPLKDAALVTATRWAVYRTLQETGLPVECGSGGRTKYNRTRQGLPKEHYYDACCVGETTPARLFFRTDRVLTIKARGRGSHQRTNVDANGFPRGYRARQKAFFGFTTGDTVAATVPKGKHAGCHRGTVLCRKSGFFDIRTGTERVQGISYRYCRPLQKADGYGYTTTERRAASSPWLKPGASAAQTR